MAAAALVTLGTGKFETHAWWALPCHGDSVPEKAGLLSLLTKDGEALRNKHAFYQEIPSTSLKNPNKSLFSAFYFCLDALYT